MSTTAESLWGLFEADWSGEDVRAPLSDLLEEICCPNLAEHIRGVSHPQTGSCYIKVTLLTDVVIAAKEDPDYHELIRLIQIMGKHK